MPTNKRMRRLLDRALDDLGGSRWEVYSRRVDALRAIAREVAAFDRACAAAEHTDTDEAWALLRRLRLLALRALRPIRIRRA